MDSAIGFPNTYLLDSDLSDGQCYPTFEQPRPDDRSFDIQTNSLNHFFEEMYEDQSGEFVFGYYIEVKGVKLVQQNFMQISKDNFLGSLSNCLSVQ